jgi:citrate synthase
MADTLTITDNRTGQQYEIPIQNGTIRAMDLRQIKATPDEFGLMTYDPAFTNTAACRSAITYIDGGKGILLYRGYPIEQLAEHSDFLESAATRCSTRTSRSSWRASGTTRIRWACS